MPHWDWTLNIPLLCTIVFGFIGAIRGFSRMEFRLQSVEGQLTRIETRMEHHESEDNRRFDGERQERHQLRNVIDGRLRHAELALARLDGRLALAGFTAPAAPAVPEPALQEDAQ